MGAIKRLNNWRNSIWVHSVEGDPGSCMWGRWGRQDWKPREKLVGVSNELSVTGDIHGALEMGSFKENECQAIVAHICTLKHKFA